jgi:predicted AAA+ superfamily ATPase
MKKIYTRNIFPEIKEYLQDDEIIVIYGARQTGKTTLMHYLMNNTEIKDYQNVYFDLENINLLNLCNKGVDEFFNYLGSRGFKADEKLFILIDEIQYLENPSNFLKLMHDRYKGKIKLIVSGSSTFSIKSKFKDSLAGRTINFELFPLSFSEFLNFKEQNYKPDENSLDEIDKELKILFREFCLFGGYPAVVHEKSIDKKQRKLEQLISTYIKVDIKDIGRIRDLTKFNNLVSVLSSQPGNLINISELCLTSKLAKQTVEEYLFILENTYIIKLLKPFSLRLRSEISKMPKLYFEDIGISSIISQNGFSNEITGSLFENSIFSELSKMFNRDSLYFWRTNKGQEIDFIIKSGNNIIPVEVKLSFTGRDISALRYFKEKYNIKKCYVCTFNKIAGSPYEWLEVIYPWELSRIK